MNYLQKLEKKKTIPATALFCSQWQESHVFYVVCNNYYSTGIFLFIFLLPANA